jgi:3-hydroxybutyryl-CoA dehydrogenase
MNVVILADEDNSNAIKINNPIVNISIVKNIEEFLSQKNIDVFFNLTENSCNENYSSIKEPIFVNSVTKTLKQINATENIVRINGWAGFIEKDIWELVGNITPAIENILSILGKKYIVLPDEAGFVSARTIAMVINEAFFAIEDNVSSEQEIDIAMKLGTNYPFGPFEWASKIGLKNIYDLLSTLSKTDERYTVSVKLIEKINQVQ